MVSTFSRTSLDSPKSSPSVGIPVSEGEPIGFVDLTRDLVPGDASQLADWIRDIRMPLLVLQDDQQRRIASLSGADFSSQHGLSTYPVLGIVPQVGLSQLGDAAFRREHRLRYAYMAGSMAGGIASEELVEAAAKGGFLASFGSAGLPLDRVEQAVDRLVRNLPDLPFCFNLIHSPNEPALEAAVVALYLRRNIRTVEASAYLDLTLPVVKYRVAGLVQRADGQVVAENKIIAKASRIEVARRWLSPPPENLVQQLVERGDITAEQAALSRFVPMAQDLTAEADSGGHTDNRPAMTLLPTILALRDELQSQFGYAQRLRVGAAGGIATPQSAYAALAMGADYLVTGSVNQACVESGTSDTVRKMLAEAQQADVIMAPAADMFEMGVKLQVLKRGTMFAMRAGKLFELYRQFDSLDAIPQEQRETLEKTVFQASIAEIWEQTQTYFRQFDPTQIERARDNPKHQMALVFRWYLGLSSRWANAGDQGRRIDYQIWCGPAMGAFNQWAKGSALEHVENRNVLTVAINLLRGAAIMQRLHQLRYFGASIPDTAGLVHPLSLDEMKEFSLDA